jgi:hypothetical protein
LNHGIDFKEKSYFSPKMATIAENVNPKLENFPILDVRQKNPFSCQQPF